MLNEDDKEEKEKQKSDSTGVTKIDEYTCLSTRPGNYKQRLQRNSKHQMVLNVYYYLHSHSSLRQLRTLKERLNAFRF